MLRELASFFIDTKEYERAAFEVEKQVRFYVFGQMWNYGVGFFKLACFKPIWDPSNPKVGVPNIHFWLLVDLRRDIPKLRNVKNEGLRL